MKASLCFLSMAVMLSGCTAFPDGGYEPTLPQSATFWLHKTELNILNGYFAWDDEDRGIHLKKTVKAGVVMDDNENLRPFKNGRIECFDSDLLELATITYKDGKLVDGISWHHYFEGKKSDDPLSLAAGLRCRNAGFPDLRHDSSALLEVRILGFAANGCGGYILRKTTAGTQAYWLKVANEKEMGPEARAVEQKPKKPWDEIWKELEKNGVLTLPDGMKLKNQHMILDGIWFLVETKNAGRFRKYTYDNPDMQPGPEAKKMVRINAICEESLEDK